MDGCCTKPFASPKLAAECLKKVNEEAILAVVAQLQRKNLKSMQLTILDHHRLKYVAHILRDIAKIELQICVHYVKSRYAENMIKYYAKLAVVMTVKNI